MAPGRGRLLLHRQDAVLRIHLHDAALVQAGLLRLVIAHDAGRPLGPRIANETAEAEIQDIVPGDDQEVVVQGQRIDGILDVAHGPQAGLVGRSTVIHDRHAGRRPLFENRREFVVGDDHETIHEAGTADVVDQPVQDGLVPYLEQGFGKILCQRIKPRGIAGGKDQAFHRLTPSAE